jgi:hypothetical protein
MQARELGPHANAGAADCGWFDSSLFFLCVEKNRNLISFDDERVPNDLAGTVAVVAVDSLLQAVRVSPD